ncbi:MAG: polyribonucleotide nucleotidyltransferase, partial [Nitrospinota bacterium]
MICRREIEIHGRTLSFETGLMAKQADGAVVVRYGDAVVLSTAVASGEGREGIDFFPLTVEYREGMYSAGRIPGGFFKREGRPTEREILACRLIDRPLRPLFPKGFRCETQLVNMVLSFDRENDTDVLAINGASTALTLSDIPFAGPVAAVRVGRVGGELVVNPTLSEQEAGDLNVVLAGVKDGIVMVEAGAFQLPEEVFLQAFELGQGVIRELIRLQEEMRAEVGKPKRELPPAAEDEELPRAVREFCTPRIREAVRIPEKGARQEAMRAIARDLVAELIPEGDPRQAKEVKALYEKVEYEEFRRLILDEGLRADGRGLKDIRPISIQTGVLPRVHGSSLFTRGETQALVTITLGTSEDEQKLDNVDGKAYRQFLLHYNFPPFCVGEAKMMRGPGRREIGHGALASRAVAGVLPEHEEFPYTIRVVSEILESNGSSSMATVCGTSLALMDAAVPVRAAVAGIAMGLIQDPASGRVAILTDIMGLEDHLGDMDFKVAGTREGITALQMDIKLKGLDPAIVREALSQAREARLSVLEEMDAHLPRPRAELSAYAPRIFTIQVHRDKVRDVIGPGGKVIRGIIEETGASIDVEDDGTIFVASVDEASAQRAIAIIRELTQEAEVGRVYLGTVRKIMDFGAFVEIFPGTDGLVHISQLARHRVNEVTDILKEGDQVLVKVLEV